MTEPTEEPELQIGYQRDGKLYNKFNELGVTHENYNVHDKYRGRGTEPPTQFNRVTGHMEIVPGHNIDGGTFLGGGAENNVYDHGDYVMKYTKGSNSHSMSVVDGKIVKTQTSALDHLIHQYKKILGIRVFQCVVNTAHERFLHMNPDKISQVPFIESLNSVITANEAAIKEDKVKDRSNPVKQIEHEIAAFVPKIVKENFFYFDTRGAGQAFKTGITPDGRPIYNVVDGVSVYAHHNKTPEELVQKYKSRNRFADEEKELARVQKFQKIITECSERELQKIFSEIEATHNLN